MQGHIAKLMSRIATASALARASAPATPRQWLQTSTVQRALRTDTLRARPASGTSKKLRSSVRQLASGAGGAGGGGGGKSSSRAVVWGVAAVAAPAIILAGLSRVDPAGTKERVSSALPGPLAGLVLSALGLTKGEESTSVPVQVEEATTAPESPRRDGAEQQESRVRTGVSALEEARKHAQLVAQARYPLPTPVVGGIAFVASFQTTDYCRP